MRGFLNGAGEGLAWSRLPWIAVKGMLKPRLAVSLPMAAICEVNADLRNERSCSRFRLKRPHTMHLMTRLCLASQRFVDMPITAQKPYFD